MSTTSTTQASPSVLEMLRSWAETRNNRRRPVSMVLLAIFVLGTVVVAWGGLGEKGYNIAGALIWGFGFCASGMLLGFLFAIPRILPAGAVIAPATKPDGSSAPPSHSTVVNPSASGESEINSNLVEVSDWLTKIIVGVGLVELKHLPEAAQRVTVFIAPGLGLPVEQGAPIVGGIMLFFSVHGFLIGYLLTRIYLAMILKWADNQVISQIPSLRLPAGTPISAVDMLSQLQNRLDDVQKVVVNLPTRPQQPDMLRVAPPVAARDAPRILWVDDVPANNASLVDSLKSSNFLIDQALSTDEALRKLSSDPSSYDLVITDMGRREGRKDVPDAGVILTEKVAGVRPNLPVLVFCSKYKVQSHGAAALKAGARLVTASSTELLREVTEILASARPA